MQLLLTRNQTSLFGYVKFHLWAKIELSREEKELITNYRVSKAILSDGDWQRDLLLSFKYAAVLGVVAAIASYFDWIPIASQLGFRFIGLGGAAITGLITFAVATYVIYNQIREEIRISDILDGRLFRCRSVLTLIAKERILTVMAHDFREFLEAMKTWGGSEVIPIEPGQKPTLRVIEPRHAAA
jgi:phage shock protein PspC (stress-responsive transcriptional regulator)